MVKTEAVEGRGVRRVGLCRLDDGPQEVGSNAARFSEGVGVESFGWENAVVVDQSRSETARAVQDVLAGILNDGIMDEHELLEECTVAEPMVLKARTPFQPAQVASNAKVQFDGSHGGGELVPWRLGLAVKTIQVRPGPEVGIVRDVDGAGGRLAGEGLIRGCRGWRLWC